jgi:UDP-glucose 4-epimerase
MTVLVTGGRGFIGTNLVQTLTEGGRRVTVLDDFSSGSRNDLPRGVRVVQGSVMDRSALRAALRDAQAVVHLAAATSVLESIADPWPGFEVNVRGTLMALEETARAGVRRFVFASSNAAVGNHDGAIDETVPSLPSSPYGASKAAGEAYCAAFHNAGHLETISLRFANAYGPFSGHKSSVIVKFLKFLFDDVPLTLYGDGNQTRDFIFGRDVAEAIVLALARPVGAPVLQIATGVETSVIDLVTALSDVTGIKPRIAWLPQPAGEVRRNYSNVSRAQSTLGFVARVPLREGLRATADWMARNRV